MIFVKKRKQKKKKKINFRKNNQTLHLINNLKFSLQNYNMI